MADIKHLGGNVYELPNGLRVVYPGGMPANDRIILQARHTVFQEYLTKWGKTVEQLSIEEILEIRKDPRWKDPLGTHES